MSVATACARENNASIERIVINGKVCARCADDLIIDRAGLIEDDGTADAVVVDDAELANRLLDRFPIDRIGNARSKAPTEPTEIAIVSIIYAGGKRDVLAVPASDGTFGGLSSWLVYAADRATHATTEPRFTAIANALRESQVRSIGLERHGCYGTCPTYDVTFDASGSATYRDRRGPCSIRATANVAFSRVLDSASAGGIARLRAAYPAHWIDTEGARIIIRTTRGRVVSDGPDESSWGPEFAVTLGRLDQIVRDTTWNPPIASGRCGPLLAPPRARV